jgi:hypothetical protein
VTVSNIARPANHSKDAVIRGIAGQSQPTMRKGARGKHDITSDVESHCFHARIGILNNESSNPASLVGLDNGETETRGCRKATKNNGFHLF